MRTFICWRLLCQRPGGLTVFETAEPLARQHFGGSFRLRGDDAVRGLLDQCRLTARARLSTA